MPGHAVVKSAAVAVAVAFAWALSATPAAADPATIAAAITAAVGLTGTAATVATFVIATVVSMAESFAISKVVSATQKQQARQASILALDLHERPREYVFGRVCTGGGLLDGGNYGGKSGTDYELLVIALADHLCDGLEGFYVGDQYYPFTGNGVQHAFDWKGAASLWVYWQPGAEHETPPVSAEAMASIGAQSGHPYACGVAKVWVIYGFNDQIYPNGRPSFRWVVRGARLYDPRLDSTVEGGSGPQRWDQPETHTWSQNAYLARYHWVRGIYATGHVGDPLHLLVGRGLSELEAPPARVIAPANVCDEAVTLKAGGTEPRYCANGVIKADDTYYEMEEHFAAAMAGVIVKRDGGVEIEPGAAKSVPPELEFDDGALVVGEKVVWRDFGNDAQRVNTIVPRYIEPIQGWTDFAAPIRRDTFAIAEDGEASEDLALLFVTSTTQAQRCGEIKLRQAKLERGGILTLGPRYSCAEDGDWVGYTSERRMDGLRRVFRVEAFSVAQSYRTSLTVREINASVYGWNAAVDEYTPGAAPPTPVPPPPPLELDDVTAAPMTQDGGEETQAPTILVTWDAEGIDLAILRIRVEVRLAGTTEVAPTYLADVTAGEAVITAGVIGDAVMQVRLIPQGDPSRDWTASGWMTVHTGALISSGAPWTGITDPSGTRPEDNATDGATIGENVKLPGGAIPSREDVLTIEGTSKDTLAVGGRPAANILAVADAAFASQQDAAGQARLNAASIVRAALASLDEEAFRDELDFVAGKRLGAVVSENNFERVTAEAALAQSVELVGANLASNIATVLGITTALATADTAQATAMSALTSRVTTAESNIATNYSTLAAADSAAATAAMALAARVTTAESNITTNYSTLAAADSAAATAATALAARVTTAESLITTNYSTLAAADSAAATAAGLLAARMTSAESAITTNYAALAAADEATASATTALAARVTTAESAIVNNYTTLTDVDTAAANALSALTATVGGHTASLTTYGSVIADMSGAMSGSWGFLIDLDGRISGGKLLTVSGGGVTTSTLDFYADRTRFWDGTSNVPLVEIGDGGLWVAGNRVRTESLAGDALRTRLRLTLMSNTALPSTTGGKTRYLSGTFTKKLDGSDVDIAGVMRPRPGNDYAGYMIVGYTPPGGGADVEFDIEWSWGSAANLTGRVYGGATQTLTSNRHVCAYENTISGLPLGTYNVWVDWVSFSAPSAGSFMEAGSTMRFEEVKR